MRILSIKVPYEKSLETYLMILVNIYNIIYKNVRSSLCILKKSKLNISMISETMKETATISFILITFLLFYLPVKQERSAIIS